MKRSFTLIELIVVIIIIGILATLGFTQYGRVLERARGGEAKTILGTIRTLAAIYYLENGSLSGISNINLNIGPDADQNPSACRPSHYFAYSTDAGTSTTEIKITATRCGDSGKTPGGGASTDTTLVLTSNLSTGVDTWSGTGNYR